jgi:hypothetical protein
MQVHVQVVTAQGHPLSGHSERDVQLLYSWWICCCVVDRLFFSFLQVCGMHCYVGITLSVTQNLFTLFLVSRPGMVVLSVYHTSHVCGDKCSSSCFVLELVGVCRASQYGDENVWISWTIIDWLLWLLASVCSLPILPVLFRKVQALSLWE